MNGVLKLLSSIRVASQEIDNNKKNFRIYYSLNSTGLTKILEGVTKKIMLSINVEENPLSESFTWMII